MACIAIIGMSVATAFDFPLPFFIAIWALYIGVWDYLALV
jgi:hypothetical protein